MKPQYRAWHKKQKVMKLVLVIDWLNGLADLNGGLIECEFKDITFEQCTGILDKNEHLIYEGDIVHATNEYKDTDFIGSVEYLNGGFCIWTGALRDYVWSDIECEIIGNIHENRELLGG